MQKENTVKTRKKFPVITPVTIVFRTHKMIFVLDHHLKTGFMGLVCFSNVTQIFALKTSALLTVRTIRTEQASALHYKMPYARHIH